MKTIKTFILCLFITLGAMEVANADLRNPLGEKIPVIVTIGIFHSGPVLPGASEVFLINIKAEDKTIIEQLRNTPEWWKYVKVFLQVNDLKSLETSMFIPQWNNARDAKKSWRFVPALENPMETAPTKEQEHVLIKKLIATPISIAPFPGAIYSFFAILDTREAAKTDKKIPSLYVPQIGVSIFQIQDKSALKNAHDNQNYIADQFTVELLQGNFKKAEEWIQKYIEAGGDPVIAADFHLKVLLYQHKFEEAYEHYKKMADMDAKYRKTHPSVEPYVLPGMVAEFKEKIAAAIQRENAATDVKKQ